MPDSVGWLATRFTRSIMDCRRPLGAAEPGICIGATGGFGRPGPLPALHARRVERMVSQREKGMQKRRCILAGRAPS